MKLSEVVSEVEKIDSMLFEAAERCSLQDFLPQDSIGVYTCQGMIGVELFGTMIWNTENDDRDNLYDSQGEEVLDEGGEPVLVPLSQHIVRNYLMPYIQINTTLKTVITEKANKL